jgi:GWxTD domain-containing protein
VALRLLQLRTDTAAALPPYWLSPSRGSLAYRGVIFESGDTLQITRRLIEQSGRESVVEFHLPRLDEGIYRVAVRADVRPADAAETEVALRQERLLSVKSATFPTVEILDDLIVALNYIAYEDEIREIREGPSVAEKKRRFDAFWGSLVPNRQVAANLLKLYYGRVEEANLFFTNYKEGWKTDRGMIYVVLGPPLYVENRIDSEVWYYSYGDRDPTRTFVFERVRAFQVDAYFDHFILQRRPYYHQEWNRAVEKWRNGTVL